MLQTKGLFLLYGVLHTTLFPQCLVQSIAQKLSEHCALTLLHSKIYRFKFLIGCDNQFYIVFLVTKHIDNYSLVFLSVSARRKLNGIQFSLLINDNFLSNSIAPITLRSIRLPAPYFQGPTYYLSSISSLHYYQQLTKHKIFPRAGFCDWRFGLRFNLRTTT